MSYRHDPQIPQLGSKPSLPKGFKGFSHQRPRPQHPRQFDPDELTRRLYLVLAEQKASSEKRRRYKAEAARQGTSTRPPLNDEEKARRRKTTSADHPPKKDGHGSELTFVERARRSSARKAQEAEAAAQANDAFSPDGHYIPQVAATQFARTTLGEAVPEADKSLVHKLSRKAMKYHMQGPLASREVTDALPSEQTNALRRAQTTRERNYERNQFQHPVSLVPLAEAVPATAAAFDGPSIDEKRLTAARRKSTGSFLGRSDPVRYSAEIPPITTILEKQPSYDHCELVGNPEDHRVDWTQSDEANRGRKSESPPLRKPDSRWPLRVRLGSFNKHARDEKTVLPASGADENGVAVEEPVVMLKSPKSPKSPKSGFFARFKR